MKGSWLTSYWIDSPVPRAPLGFEVTAFSLNEAIRVIQAEGCPCFFRALLPRNHNLR
jgi:hypothetical protein